MSSSIVAAISESKCSNHMPATVTQNPEPQVLYEHCVRPSGVRSRSSRRCHSSKLDASLARLAINDKSMQTEGAMATIDAQELRGQSNEEVHTTIEDAGEGSERYWSSEAPAVGTTSSPSRSPASVHSGERRIVRAESRDSLSTWPPTDASELLASAKEHHRSLKKKKTHRKRPAQQQQQTQTTSFRSVGTNTQERNMPQLEWSSGFRPDRQIHRALRKLSSFVLCGTLILAFSTIMQWTFLTYQCQAAAPVRGDHRLSPIEYKLY